MKISIIIPTLNESSNIKDAVDSAWNSGGDEVIVADGQSEDETIAITNNLDCKLVVSSPGRGTQLNRGAKMASGDVLLFLHADNRLAANACDQIRNGFHRKYAYGAFKQRIEHSAKIYRWLEWGNELRARWRRMPYGDQGIFVWKNVFDSVSGFPDIPLMEEVALCDKLKKISRPALLEGPINVDPRRWQDKGVVKQTIRNWILFTRYRMGASPETLSRRY